MSIAHRFLPVKSGFPVIFLHFFPFSLILHYALCVSHGARQNDPGSPATLSETVFVVARPRRGRSNLRWSGKPTFPSTGHR